MLARVCGFGVSTDTQHQGADSRQYAIRRSIQDALHASQVSPDQLSHVNAHGLSTPQADADEARAIEHVLGQVPVTALKSYFGNLGPAGGLVELVGSVLALSQQQVPRTLNYCTPDPRCPIHVVHRHPVANSGRYVLKLNQSSTGQTAALVIGRVDA
jgi:3-oxoacyl-[acyl-carrier-protein] synthase II